MSEKHKLPDQEQRPLIVTLEDNICSQPGNERILACQREERPLVNCASKTNILSFTYVGMNQIRLFPREFLVIIDNKT
jgi:hypothetical protein